MLVKLSVENFKSFDAPTEIEMVSSSKIQAHPEHKIRLKNTNILKYGVFYGANAAGKSNMVKLFRFFKACTHTGLPLNAGQMFCKNKEENKTRESSFEMIFTIENSFYAYGFSALLSERKITGEWLYELFPEGQPKCLFERNGDEPPRLGSTSGFSAGEEERFRIYAEDFAGRDTMLFLSEMNRGKKYTDQSKLYFFKEVYEWIEDHIYIITPNARLTDLEYYYDNSSLQRINELISTFDTGISEIKTEEISMEELSTMIPDFVFKELLNHMKEKTEKEEFRKLRITMRSEDSFFSITGTNSEEPKVTTLRLHHGNSFFDFDFMEESDGTRRIFDLMDMILNKKENILYVVDELERSLHPKLLEHFLRLFMESHKEQQVQLLFSTHEASIMEQSLFRRDEIWFIERDEKNASKLYSLDRFKERYDKLLSKAYLEGRYGAIPVLTDFSFKEAD